MRLLLDEHYPSEIAERLRERGHDAIAVAERQDLTSLSDRALLEAAAAEKRVLLTENVAHFAPLARLGEHQGLVFSSNRSMPRSRNTIGRFVRELDSLLRAYPADGALLGQWIWIPQDPD